MDFLMPLFSVTDVAFNDAVKVAVVSNFDTRLRTLLKDLNVLDLYSIIPFF